MAGTQPSGKGRNSTWQFFPMPEPKCRGIAWTSSCCPWPLYSHPPQEWLCHSWGSRGSPRGTTMTEIRSNLSQQSEKVCFRAKNTGISLPVVLKDVFFPEPPDWRSKAPASIWLPRRTCTNSSQRWNVILVPLNDFAIHRFCLWQRVMISPVVTFVKSRTLYVSWVMNSCTDELLGSKNSAFSHSAEKKVWP